MVQVVWSPRAWRDLDDIQNRVALDRPNAAERLRRRIIAAGDSLSRQPDRGRTKLSGVRELTNVRPYIIRYRHTGMFVIILEVRHAGRRPLP